MGILKEEETIKLIVQIANNGIKDAINKLNAAGGFEEKAGIYRTLYSIQMVLNLIKVE